MRKLQKWNRSREAKFSGLILEKVGTEKDQTHFRNFS